MHRLIENVLQVMIGIGLMYLISSVYEKHRTIQLMVAPLYETFSENKPDLNYENDFDSYQTEPETYEATKTPPISDFEDVNFNQTARIPQVF